MGELARTLDTWEWEYWAAIYYTEGFAEDRDDMRCNLLANLAAHCERPEDFFPDVWRDPEEVAIEDKINFAFTVAKETQKENAKLLGGDTL